MANSIYNDFQPKAQNLGNFLTQFNQFCSMFSGDPQQQVQQLIQSGRMSQSQFDELAQQANLLRQFLK